MFVIIVAQFMKNEKQTAKKLLPSARLVVETTNLKPQTRMDTGLKQHHLLIYKGRILLEAKAVEMTGRQCISTEKEA